ncbi:MAG: cobalamin biosynthesis protein [Proteobacteria bacterium]|nr:cobalamin biosynthesis protein [Pseudomonadota bacterium]
MIEVLLAGLGAGALDRWLSDRSRIDPLPWYRDWIDSIEQRFNGGQFFHGLSALALAVLPLLFVVLLARWVAYQFGIVVGFGFDVLALFFCIRIDWLHQSAGNIGHLLKHGRLLDAQVAVRSFGGHSVTREDEQAIAEAAIEAVLCKTNTLVIAPLFWFAMLGPVGAVMQLLVNVTRRRWLGREDRFGQFGLATRHAYCALNWLPARISVACYAMMGSFYDAIHGWRDTRSYWCNSEELLANSGFAAMQLDRSGQQVEQHEDDEDQEPRRFAQAGHVRRAVALAWRAVLFIGVMLLVMSLSSWLNL